MTNANVKPVEEVCANCSNLGSRFDAASGSEYFCGKLSGAELHLCKGEIETKTCDDFKMMEVK